MKIDLPLDRLPNVDKKMVLKYIHKVSWIETIVYYIVDWRTRKQIKIFNWLKDNLELPGDLLIKSQHIAKCKTNNLKIKAILRFVNKYINYMTDQLRWDVKEKWQTPFETWNLKTGDCEDGAILIIAMALFYGIPDYQIYLVAGEVMGGGHAYCVFVSDKDTLEYPIDWCYWYKKSYDMKIPYIDRSEYYDGKKEWFRVNQKGVYKLWKS